MMAATPVRLPPVEQCTGDPGFSQLRMQLEAAVKARDLDALLSLMSDDVRVTFGGRFGREGFRQHWDASAGRSDELWRELDDVLKLGCGKAVDGNGVPYRAMPAMFMTSGDLDGFTTFVARPGAKLRTRASIRAPVSMRIPAWTVLDEVHNDGGQWVKVRTPRGRRGFVSTDEVRSIIDYRLVFGRRNDSWKITAFVAGD